MRLPRSYSSSSMNSLASSYGSSPGSPCSRGHSIADRRAWAEGFDDVDISSYTLSDLGYCNRDPCSGSSFGVTDTFPLLSKSACERIRNESTLSDSQLIPSQKLCRELLSWFTSEKFENLVNRAIDVPVCIKGKVWEDFASIHYHSAAEEPSTSREWQTGASTFVLTVNLSEIPDDAQGGETLLKTGDDQVARLSFTGGGAGHAYVLQAGKVEHCFTPPINYELLTMTIRLSLADGWDSPLPQSCLSGPQEEDVLTGWHQDEDPCTGGLWDVCDGDGIGGVFEMD